MYAHRNSLSRILISQYRRVNIALTVTLDLSYGPILLPKRYSRRRRAERQGLIPREGASPRVGGFGCPEEAGSPSQTWRRLDSLATKRPVTPGREMHRITNASMNRLNTEEGTLGFAPTTTFHRAHACTAQLRAPLERGISLWVLLSARDNPHPGEFRV